MREKEWSPANIFDVFGDPVSRQIIVLTNGRTLSAEGLAERLDVSLPTVYRRTNKLVEYDLLTEELRLTDDGNQYKVFETKLKRLTFEVTAGGYTVETEMKHDLVGGFEGFWTDLGQASDQGFSGGDDYRHDASGDPS